MDGNLTFVEGNTFHSIARKEIRSFSIRKGILQGDPVSFKVTFVEANQMVAYKIEKKQADFIRTQLYGHDPSLWPPGWGD